MQRNVGGTDRQGRTILGTVLVSAGLVAPVDPYWRAALVGIGAVALATAATAYCPLNAALGLDTAHPG